MRIVQLLSTIAPGDAVSNDARALQRLLRRWDRGTEIYAENIGHGLPAGLAKKAEKLPRLREDDVLIYHMSIGSDLSLLVEEMSCRKVMIYHNITPPEHFARYSEFTAYYCEKGRRELRRMKDCFDYCIADSDFNRQDLRQAGYTCPIDVCPIFIPFDDYAAAADERTLHKYGDGRTNFLFVGRIAPNKKQEDVIAAFAAYQRRYDADARLILAGNPDGMERYKKRLWAYARAIGVRNVSFTGHIPFAELLAHYRTASVFLCQSEHEGFCVPLTEAMYFDVPIVAYAAAAVPETLGGSGIVLEEKTPELTAAVLHRLVTDEGLRAAVIENQRERLGDFAGEKVAQRFAALFEAFLERAPHRKKHVVQLLPALTRQDALGRSVLKLREILAGLDCRESIWTWNCPEDRLRDGVHCSQNAPALTAEDVAVFHAGAGMEMAGAFLALPCRKILFCHEGTERCRQMEKLVAAAELCLADTAGVAEGLRKLGAKNTVVLPLLSLASDCAGEADAYTLRKYGDGRCNVLFAGDMLPQERVESVIRAFSLYRRRFDPAARLILAGSDAKAPGYVKKLRLLAAELGEENVVFTGALSRGEGLALYKTASVFLSLSEREGFALPTLEAMSMGVPVAVGGGELIPEATAESAAAAIRALMSVEELRAAVLEQQRQYLDELAPEAVTRRAAGLFGEVLHG